MPKAKAILFDLDDTLFDCYGLLVEAARRRAARAMVQAGLPCTEEEAYQRQIEPGEQPRAPSEENRGPRHQGPLRRDPRQRRRDGRAPRRLLPRPPRPTPPQARRG